MNDTESIEQAVEAFNNLSSQDTAMLKELNTKIKEHEGKWGLAKGGERTASGAIQMPWIENDPLIYEFLDFMRSKNLLPPFDWTKWDEGSKLFASEDPNKYDGIDVETALKIIVAATRKERFSDGTLAKAFEVGGFPQLVNRLAGLKVQLDE